MIEDGDEYIKEELENLQDEDFYLWRSNRIRNQNNFNPELIISVRNSSLKKLLLRVFKFFENEKYDKVKILFKDLKKEKIDIEKEEVNLNDKENFKKVKKEKKEKKDKKEKKEKREKKEKKEKREKKEKKEKLEEKEDINKSGKNSDSDIGYVRKNSVKKEKFKETNLDDLNYILDSNN